MASLARMAPDMDAHIRRCIELCRECHETCLNTLAYCLRMGGKHAEEPHLRLLMDCTEICQTSANFMLRESSFHGRVCGACADICESCADSCASMSDDDRMEACAEICRDCATLCRELSVTGSA